MNPEWLRADWPAPPNVHVLSTFRTGGESQAPFDSLNLGGHVGDAASTVAANRQRLASAARLPAEPAWLAQVHGLHVVDLDAPGSSATADASFTRQPGRVCAILTADCLPVIFASRTGDVVGAAHAGWRGLAAGVLEATVGAMGAPAADLLAWLGPAIGPGHFEVGAEVRAAFVDADPGAGVAFAANERGRFMADLALLATRRLMALGLVRIYASNECTHARPERYFSHRRDGITGRQATLIWRAGG